MFGKERSREAAEEVLKSGAVGENPQGLRFPARIRREIFLEARSRLEHASCCVHEDERRGRLHEALPGTLKEKRSRLLLEALQPDAQS